MVRPDKFQAPGAGNGKVVANRSLKVLLVSTGLTMLFFLGWIGWDAVKSYRVSLAMHQRHLEIERVRQGIIYLDEVLTMSARLSALTSDPQWEIRYKQNEPKLDSMIKRAIAFTNGEEGKKALELTDSSNIRLVELERCAMELSLQDNPNKAVALLLGDEYIGLKKTYAKGMDGFYRVLEESISKTQARTRANLRNHLLLVFLALVALLMVWAVVARVINRWHLVLMEMNQNLSQKTEALTRFNEQLDERVKSATEDLKNRHSQLMQSEKMAALGLLAAGVAHEINNPLSFLKSNMATLGDYMVPIKNALREVPMDEKEDLEFIVGDIGTLISQSGEGIDRVTAIVKGLRSFVQLDSSENLEADINEGLEATIKLVSGGLAKKTTIRKRLSPLPPILCHLGKLNQAFLNILMNAIQSSGTEGEVTVESRLQGDWIMIGISDNGKGISQEHLSKIFSPFFTTKPVGQGMGLGLSVAYGIVKDHGGRIEVESVIAEKTTFTIYLPAPKVSLSGQQYAAGDAASGIL
jgi:signal transduction histidine kinase